MIAVCPVMCLRQPGDDRSAVAFVAGRCFDRDLRGLRSRRGLVFGGAHCRLGVNLRETTFYFPGSCWPFRGGMETRSANDWNSRIFAVRIHCIRRRPVRVVFALSAGYRAQLAVVRIGRSEAARHPLALST